MKLCKKTLLTNFVTLHMWNIIAISKKGHQFVK